jgi:branched-chain amino acid transport system ATP-binding protein
VTSSHIQGQPAVRLNSVTRSFGGLKAVENVSISIEKGMKHAIIGPNGAGKTTLFAMISGELELSEGQVFMFGQDVSKWSATRRARNGLGRTYQITNVFTGLTVEQNITLAIRGNSNERLSLLKNSEPDSSMSQAIDEVLDRCGLLHRRHTLTGDMAYGEQRLLELAIALANRPKLLLLDEPAAGLSPAERAPMAETIRNLPKDLTVMLIEHDMELALGLADYVTCLYYGQVLASGTPKEIQDNPEVQSVYFGVSGDA